MAMHEENAESKQGNVYDSFEPSCNAEGITTDVENPVHQTSTQPGIREPVYDEAQWDPQREWNSTLLELLNPMYQAITTTPTLQQNQESEYQQTQKEVKNILYGDLLEACSHTNT